MPSADFLGTSEPAYENMFLIYFTRLPSITPLYVASSALPELAWGEAKSSYFISERKFAQRATVGEFSLVVKDFVTVDTAAAVYAWYRSVGDPNAGILNAPSVYKSNGIYILTDGRGNPLNTWTLKGCWPKDCKFGSLNTEGTQIVSITISIAVDSIELG
jgi:hypothetical protein